MPHRPDYETLSCSAPDCWETSAIKLPYRDDWDCPRHRAAPGDLRPYEINLATDTPDTLAQTFADAISYGASIHVTDTLGEHLTYHYHSGPHQEPVADPPNTKLSDALKVRRVEGLLTRWHNTGRRIDGAGVSHLLAELHLALGHQPEREDP